MTDGELGTDGLSLTGLDAGMFKIVGNALYLKEGAELDFEAKPTLSIEILASRGDELDGAASFTLNVESASETAASEAISDTLVFAPGYGEHERRAPAHRSGVHWIRDVPGAAWSPARWYRPATML